MHPTLINQLLHAAGLLAGGAGVTGMIALLRYAFKSAQLAMLNKRIAEDVASGRKVNAAMDARGGFTYSSEPASAEPPMKSLP